MLSFWFGLDVVVGEGAAVFKLLALKNEAAVWLGGCLPYDNAIQFYLALNVIVTMVSEDSN